MATETPLKLNVLLSRQDGCWVATCTELDVVVADPDMERAWEDATRVCRAHLMYGLRTGHSLHDLVKPPPENLGEIMEQMAEDGVLTINLCPSLKAAEAVEIHRLISKAA